MISQAWSDEGKIVRDLVKKDVKMYGLFGKNTVVPREIWEDIISTDIEQLLQRENFQQRQIEKVEVAVYITDERCAIMFPNRKGEIDMNNMFVGNDSRAREWCNDVFDHYWKFSKPITSFKDFIK